jgi:hypothetical protein
MQRTSPLRSSSTTPSYSPTECRPTLVNWSFASYASAQMTVPARLSRHSTIGGPGRFLDPWRATLFDLARPARLGRRCPEAARCAKPRPRWFTSCGSGRLTPIPPISHHHSRALPQRNLRLRPSQTCGPRGRFEARKRGVGRKKKPRQSGAGSGMWVTGDDFPSRCSASSLMNLATTHE